MLRPAGFAVGFAFIVIFLLAAGCGKSGSPVAPLNPADTSTVRVVIQEDTIRWGMNQSSDFRISLTGYDRPNVKITMDNGDGSPIATLPKQAVIFHYFRYSEPGVYQAICTMMDTVRHIILASDTVVMIILKWIPNSEGRWNSMIVRLVVAGSMYDSNYGDRIIRLVGMGGRPDTMMEVIWSGRTFRYEFYKSDAEIVRVKIEGALTPDGKSIERLDYDWSEQLGMMHPRRWSRRCTLVNLPLDTAYDKTELSCYLSGLSVENHVTDVRYYYDYFDPPYSESAELESWYINEDAQLMVKFLK